MCGCLPNNPRWGAGLQPRHVPRLGLELRPFGSQARAQSTEPHQRGLHGIILSSVRMDIKICTCALFAPALKN